MVSPNEAEISHYLGIDFGKKHIGLAKAESVTRIAFCYGTLDNDKDFFQKLIDIIKKETIGTVVIGVPSYVNEEDTVYDGENLGYEIRKALPDIHISLQNEMFTTKLAKHNILERGGKKIKESDHEEAARIILQEWLDRIIQHGA